MTKIGDVAKTISTYTSGTKGLKVGNGWPEYGNKPFIVVVKGESQIVQTWLVPANNERNARLRLIADKGVDPLCIVTVLEPTYNACFKISEAVPAAGRTR
jgi:hypothetical protein